MDKKEYIEREEVLRKISKMIDDCKKDYKVNALTALFQVVDTVVGCKPADVQEVVKCGNCRNYTLRGGSFWCVLHMVRMHSDDFCSYGKRKDGGENGDL